ncbi:transglycosylase domain-containing protein [Actinoplanes sp. NPDC051859]|uniref:transglycosylase domain-containing protein n=1 Tax=Actinoplanes sp. NPDC051859 TaxID=3363909 RepID=UPI00379EFA21
MTSWMRRRDHNIFTNVSSLLICGLLAGVVVAAAAFPAVAMSGLAAKAGGQTFASLPSELKAASAPQISRIFASDDKTQISVFYDEFRSDVPLKDISKYMQQAIIAAEDHSFFDHNGVDLKGVARALVSNNSGKTSQQGASTLTMQYVRMSLAYSATNPQEVVDATKDTPKRKITEMKYAMQVEKELSKEQILESYLNQAPFGNGSYGVFAASQVYFKKKPKDLTIAESALLASMVKAPTAFNPTTASGHPQAVARRDYVVQDMLEMQYITPAEAKKATETPVAKTVQRAGNGCVSVAKNHWGFFCDYFYRWWLSRDEFGATTYERERRLKSGGYRIRTSMDIKAQAAARENIADRLGEKNKNALLLAGIQPGTGKVRTLATNRRFKLDDPANPQNKISSDPAKAKKKIRGTYPNTTNPLMTGGGDITGYQAGSVFKIFTIVAALENGYPLAYSINAPKKYLSKYITEPGPATCGRYYCPMNANLRAGGVLNMWSAFGRSTNTYFVPLQERVGAEKVVNVAKRFGIQFRAQSDAKYAATEESAHQWGAFTLGVSSSTPLDMANAYATLAGDGMYCDPTPVEQITAQNGDKLDVGKPHCVRATTPDVARAALDAARCPVGDSPQTGSCNGSSTESRAYNTIRHPIYGKTGTTDGFKTTSLIIGSSTLALAGYMVNPDYQNHPDRMDHEVVNPAVYQAMADYLKGTPKVEFKKPESRKLSIGDQRSIPDVTCSTVAGARARLEGSGFSASIGVEVESRCPKGTAAGTNPSGRTIKGGYVSIEISKGNDKDKPGDDDGPRRPGRPGRR